MDSVILHLANERFFALAQVAALQRVRQVGVGDVRGIVAWVTTAVGRPTWQTARPVRIWFLSPSPRAP